MVGPIITFLVDPKKNSVESCQELLADLCKQFDSYAEYERENAKRAATAKARANAAATEATWLAAKAFVANIQVKG